jgi:type II secretory pathway component HofQ
MRVYLPATVEALRALMQTGQVGPAPLRGYAVTPALREWYVDDDPEALEYAALLEAARASLRLLDLDPKAPRRRVVIAVDAPSPVLRPQVERSAVELPEPVPMRLVAAAHVDAPEAEPAVSAAADAVIEADLGSEDAQFVLDEAEGHELAWYATQEIGPLLELL